MRAHVVAPDGRFVASVRVPIVAFVSPQPGWAEQDPEVHWAAVVEATRRVLADPAVRRDALAGVAITTQRGTVVVTDDAGRPLRPAMIWLDDRRTEGLPPLGGVGGPTGRGVPGARAARHDRGLRRRLRGQLDPGQRARHVAAPSATTCCCRASSTIG